MTNPVFTATAIAAEAVVVLAIILGAVTIINADAILSAIEAMKP